MMLFTPSIEQSDIKLSDGVINCGEKEYATLIIKNHGVEKLKLKKGTVLGVLETVTELTDSDETPEPELGRVNGEPCETLTTPAGTIGDPSVGDSVGDVKPDERAGGTELSVNRING